VAIVGSGTEGGKLGEGEGNRGRDNSTRRKNEKYQRESARKRVQERECKKESARERERDFQCSRDSDRDRDRGRGSGRDRQYTLTQRLPSKQFREQAGYEDTTKCCKAQRAIQSD
jgi:hypothetical protein